MRESVHATNRFGIHERLGVEVRNFAGNLYREFLGVEMLNMANARAPGEQSVPKRGDPDAERRDCPQPGHDDPFHDLSLSRMSLNVSSSVGAGSGIPHVGRQT